MLSITPYDVVNSFNNYVGMIYSYLQDNLPEPRIIDVKTDEPEAFFEDFKDRYSGIDLGYYKTAMTDHQYRVFKDYIGKERLGVKPSDLEVYYPDYEG